jgi:hypothetical protein
MRLKRQLTGIGFHLRQQLISAGREKSNCFLATLLPRRDIYKKVLECAMSVVLWPGWRLPAAATEQGYEVIGTSRDAMATSTSPKLGIRNRSNHFDGD